MTTREQIIAIAEEVKANNDMFGNFSVALYNIAFEAGRQAEREECAKEADYYRNHSALATIIAKDIRARGDSK